MDFKKVELCSRGVNWGDAHFHGNLLSFDADGQEEFTIALPDVKNCTKHAKNELIIEFHDDDTAQKTDDMLVEIRFVVPTGEGDKEVENPFDLLHKKIVEKADISSETADVIASFEGLQFVTPRGKYNVDLHKKYIRLHGKSYSFKILYKSVSTLFLLPKPGGQHQYFVVSLDTPIRQGQKAYYHLVFQFDKATTIKKEKPMSLQLDDKDLEKYADKGLKREMDGKMYEVVAKVFRALADRKLIGAGKFSSFSGDSAIKCSMKANEGFLFFLEKSLFFLHKPAIYMRHEEIKGFKFARTDNRAGGSRYFDLMVLLKNGKSWTFSNINKNEHDNLVNFISGKGLNIENLKEMQEAAEAAVSYATVVGGDDDDSEEDEDFIADAHDSDEDDREFEEFTTETAKVKDHGEDEAEAEAGDSQKSEKKPKESKKRKRENDEEKPKKKKSKKDTEEGGEEKPKKKKKKATEGDEEKPKKKKKKASEEEKPKKKKKKATEDGEKPKKKKKKAEEGEEKPKKKKKSAKSEE
jgi:structure-specific recognition protein 1